MLFLEHFLQRFQDCRDRARRQPTQPLDQTFTINGTHLIEGNEPRTVLKPARHAPRIDMAARCHGRNDDRAQVFVEFVGRHHQAGTCFPDFAPDRRIKPHKMHVAAHNRTGSHRHCHSLSSKWLDVVASSS